MSNKKNILTDIIDENALKIISPSYFNLDEDIYSIYFDQYYYELDCLGDEDYYDDVFSKNKLIYISPKAFALFSQNNLSIVYEDLKILKSLSSDKQIKILSALKILFKETYDIVDNKKERSKLFIHIPENINSEQGMVIHQVMPLVDFLKEEDGITGNILKQALGFHSRRLEGIIEMTIEYIMALNLDVVIVDYTESWLIRNYTKVLERFLNHHYNIPVRDPDDTITHPAGLPHESSVNRKNLLSYNIKSLESDNEQGWNNE